MDKYFKGMTEAELQLYNYCRSFENENCILLPNLMLERSGEGTNQFDLILLTDRGIFVIEYKGYSGAIYGNEFNKEWTVFYRDGSSAKMRNPVKQNENHIKTLTSLLRENNINLPIHNLVVFGDAASMNKVESSVRVIKKEQISHEVSLYPQLLLPPDILKDINELLRKNNITSDEERSDHIDFVSSISGNKLDFVEKKEVSTPMPQIRNTDRSYYSKNYKYQSRQTNRQKSKIIGLIVLLLIVWSYNAASNMKKPVNSIPIEMNSSVNSESTKTLGQTDSHSDSDISMPENIDLKLDIGASKELVIQLFGSPSKENPNDWQYVLSTVTFDSEGRVSGWINNGQLNAGVYTPKEGAKKLEVGLTKEEVRDLLGSPNSITSHSPNDWKYILSSVTFDSEGRVSGWVNNGQLNIGVYTPKEGAKKLEIGLTKEEVRDLLGSPNSITSHNPNDWKYALSSVTFDAKGKVKSWINNGQLTNYLAD